MKNKILMLGLMLMMLPFVSDASEKQMYSGKDLMSTSLDEDASNEAIKAAFKNALKKTAKRKMDLDVYDNDLDKVRNLEYIELHKSIKKDEGVYTICVDYKDKNTKELIDVDISAKIVKGQLSIEKSEIHNVGDKIEEKEVMRMKGVINPSDEVIKATIKEALDKKAEASGTIDMFDMAQKKLVRLEFVEFTGKVKKRSPRYSSMVSCKDTLSGDMVDLKVILKNKNAQLKVESIKIVSKIEEK